MVLIALEGPGLWGPLPQSVEEFQVLRSQHFHPELSKSISSLNSVLFAFNTLSSTRLGERTERRSGDTKSHLHPWRRKMSGSHFHCRSQIHSLFYLVRSLSMIFHPSNIKIVSIVFKITNESLRSKMRSRNLRLWYRTVLRLTSTLLLLKLGSANR